MKPLVGFWNLKSSKKGDAVMKTENMPLLRASSVISSHRTTFRTLDKCVVIEAPGRLVRSLIELCDGTRTTDAILQAMRQEWDETSVRELLGELFRREILIDSRRIAQEVWKAVRNPMPFPTNLSHEEVIGLVASAKERHRADVSEQTFFPEQSSLSDLLTQRKSVRSFSGELVPLQSVINMLWSAYGAIEDKDGYSHRTSPSAGALYPLMIHLVLFNATDEMKPAVYQVGYQQNGGVALQFVSKDTMQFARAFLNPPHVQSGAHGVIVISGSFAISGEKYGNRSLLYVPIEAGHVAQNILLEAVTRKVATLELGGFVDTLLREAIDLPDEYQPLTTIVFGKEDEFASVRSTNSNLEIDWAVPMVGDYRPPFAMASARVSEERSWSHGRDAVPMMALTKANSEAREWMSCGCIPVLQTGRVGDFQSAVDPRAVICFHPVQYRRRNFPFAPFDQTGVYEWTKGYELVTGKEVSILADLVYFPYFPETQYYAYANSSGCAAHPNEQVAIETGTLELVERDSFMISYLTKLVRPTLDPRTFPNDIRERIECLEAQDFKVWVKDHSLDLAPSVLVFAQNDELTFTTCASCASFDVVHAVSHALMEVEASVVSRLQNGRPIHIKPSEVGMPLDHGRLYGQKQYYRRANFLVEGGDVISLNDAGREAARNWSTLLERFADRGWRPIRVPLHLSEEFGGNDGLHIVRSVVPGMVPMTFGYRQEPAGMERIYSVAKEFGRRELSYDELTKFPHPFE
jgi:ribosomal protein S12 methylthiotransferase accessory factor